MKSEEIKPRENETFDRDKDTTKNLKLYNKAICHV